MCVCVKNTIVVIYLRFFFLRSAIRAYKEVLYLDTQFIRRADIHLRLGLIYKKLGDYSTSLKHFQRASTDPTGGCSLSRSELSYLIGLINERLGNLTEAQNIYEKLLEEDSLPLKLEGVVLRQLGCLYFSLQTEDQIQKAIVTLEKASKCDPTCGLTYYYLGRCYATLKKHTEAFFTYRNCVDKLDQNADVWCSIGVLYQYQNQTMDALQAFVCAIQIDNKHATAWLNLGILYETSGYTQDALICYRKAIQEKDGRNRKKNGRSFYSIDFV